MSTFWLTRCIWNAPGLAGFEPNSMGLMPSVALPPIGAAASPALPTGSGVLVAWPSAMPLTLRHAAASSAIAEFFITVSAADLRRDLGVFQPGRAFGQSRAAGRIAVLLQDVSSD